MRKAAAIPSFSERIPGNLLTVRVKAGRLVVANARAGFFNIAFCLYVKLGL